MFSHRRIFDLKKDAPLLVSQTDFYAILIMRDGERHDAMDFKNKTSP